MVNHLTEFVFNFNTRGYLAYCIPVFATFGRTHPGNSAERVPQELHDQSEKYLREVVEFRKQFERGEKTVVFRDRAGKPVPQA